MPSSGLLSPRANAASAARAASMAWSKLRTQIALTLPSWRSMRPIASCVSSTEETFFAFSAVATSTAVLKLHGDFGKARSRSISRNEADDAQFGQTPQEQRLYSGVVRYA